MRARSTARAVASLAHFIKTRRTKRKQQKPKQFNVEIYKRPHKIHILHFQKRCKRYTWSSFVFLFDAREGGGADTSEFQRLGLKSPVKARDQISRLFLPLVSCD